MKVIIGEQVFSVKPGVPIGVWANQGERKQIGEMSEKTFGIYIQYLRKDEVPEGGMATSDAKEYMDRIHKKITEN